LLLLSVLFSGCTGKKNIAPAPDSKQKEVVDVSSQNVTHSSKEENIPEISITSLSSVYLHDNSEQKDIYLFSWENVPGNESHRLRSYLQDYFFLDWVENANIIKDDERKIIRVFGNENSITIMLFNESAQINLGKDGSSNLYVKEENGTHNFYDTNQKYQNKYDISPRYYTAYNLSIKNNGSTSIDFKLTRLHLRDGDQIFNTTTLEPHGSRLLEVLDDFERENKIHDTVLLPGQILNGSVVFRVNSLYNESFLLMYNTTHITSESFEKSIEALRTAEHFNYSVALGVPPYCNVSQRGRMIGSYEPDFGDCCNAWANWVNRNIFETFQKSDVERMQKSPPDFIPVTKMVYALKIMPEKNITIFPVTTRLTNHLLVINDAGNEIINTSDVQYRTNSIAILSNQTYIQPGWVGNIPRMNFSNAYVVQISFEGTYGWPMSSRLSFNNQDVILDDRLNINVVRSESSQFLS
jgi:hypothetical protein